MVVDGGLGEAGQHVVISHNLVCHAPDDELALCNGKPGNVLVSKKADRRRRGPELGGGAVAAVGKAAASSTLVSVSCSVRGHLLRRPIISLYSKSLTAGWIGVD